MIHTAILVDGGFYRKRAAYLWGRKSPEDRANELNTYCIAHIKDTYDLKDERYLYRIFYYDCPPLDSTVFHPFLKKNIYFAKSITYSWTYEFFTKLKEKRKFALRLGTLSDDHAGFSLKQEQLKKICSKTILIDDLSENDFKINFEQKGVDMRIGLDIASLSYKKQVDQIILISGDSDFVPAAKLARREGIDFILDPMWAKIKDDLFEHIDGLKSQWKKT
ncbi:MAG TPA: NYN domain-containing protein [Clostridia bacterium]|nr:NYN domain-containing protein [Clostridia bacterium]HPQ45902.1 NYN domain-containing protein [Clostridia bacterium]HRX41819.1 NYN domain-containing protein [Clostridia bacterium]